MRRTTRLGAYVASAALALTGTLTGVAPANAATHDPIGVDSALPGSWRQLSSTG